MALQHRRVMEAAAKGEDLPDSFPLDPDGFEYLYPDAKVPAAARALIARIREGVPATSWSVGIGVYRGRFLPGVEHYVVHLDTNGDHGYLCVLDTNFQLVACACRTVERMLWVTLEEMIPYARTSTPHPAVKLSAR